MASKIIGRLQDNEVYLRQTKPLKGHRLLSPVASGGRAEVPPWHFHNNCNKSKIKK